jgi:hypothetical protein
LFVHESDLPRVAEGPVLAGRLCRVTAATQGNQVHRVVNAAVGARHDVGALEIPWRNV